MFSNLFGFKKNRENYFPEPPPDANWSYIGTDIHSHLIPGIDDGAKNIEDSISLIQLLVGMGYRNIVTTPHIMIDYYPNNSKIILEGLNTLQNELKSRNIEIPIKAAAEYYIDESFIELLEKEPLLCITGQRVLVEFSMVYEPPMLFEVIFKMFTSGYTPIIAHPERYSFLFNRIDKFRELKDRGCLFQLNMLSLTGYYGQNVKKIAQILMEKRLYDYVGTDMHHEKHAEAIKRMLLSGEYYHTLISYPFQNSQITF